MSQQERYTLGRKALLASGLGMIVIFAITESNIISRSLGNARPLSTLKGMPVSKFQLAPDEGYQLNLGVAPGEGNGGRHNATLRTIWEPAPLALRETFQVNYNLKAREGKLLEESHPEVFEWYRFSQVSTKHQKSRKRILMAQYSSTNDAAQIFKLTKPVNRRYAEQWGIDIVFLNAQELSTTKANMATLLEIALERREEYDQVFLMDADCMLTSLRHDISWLLPTRQMVAAKRPHGVELWEVYGTVSIWNLDHLLVPMVARTWGNRYAEGDPFVGLDEQLKPYETEIYGLWRQVGQGPLTYIRTMDSAWKTRGRRKKVDRKILLANWATEVGKACRTFRLDCQNLSTEESRLQDLLQRTGESSCQDRQEPKWEWHKQKGIKTKSKRRLLIGQHSSYGREGEVLELTAPMNKLYASIWNADYVAVQGSTMMVNRDNGCEPPPTRAAFDKLELLRVALHKRDRYDYLLLLDSDAMIRDLNFDVTTLANEKDMLLAEANSHSSKANVHTSNVTSSVLLFDLNHASTKDFADAWYLAARDGVEDGKFLTDEYYLRSTLQKKSRRRYVHAIFDEFQNRNGTVVAHFSFPDDPDREKQLKELQHAVEETCNKFSEQCIRSKMEITSYSG